MANVLKVREDITSYEDPGPYNFPEGTVARPATNDELEADGIEVKPLPDESRRLHRQSRMMHGGSMKGHSHD